MNVKPGIGHFDKIYSQFVNDTVPIWKALHITPNILTTFGLCSSLLCIYFIYKRIAVLAVLFLLFRQYFDYADGITARRYNQTSDFGDWYDHIVDVCAFGIPLLLLLYMAKRRWLYLAPVVFFMITSVVNIGCIEKQYHEQTGKGGASLQGPQKICFAPSLFQWMDNSVLYIVVCIVIIHLCHADKITRIHTN